MHKIIKTIDNLGVSENTIICFSSHHGDHVWSHGYGKCSDTWMHYSKHASKATPFDESIHIPFIIRWPSKVKGHQRTQVLFNRVDIMPTLLGLCEISIPEEVNGSDLSHIIIGGGGGNLPVSVYLQIIGEGWPNRGKWVGFWRGVRNDRWLYARWYKNENGPFLFDRQNYPYEMTNLYGNPEYSEISEMMEKRLKKWMDDTKDPFETGERDPETGMLLLGFELTEKENRIKKRK
jgi:arylsulfatase A-like enzyme